MFWLKERKRFIKRIAGFTLLIAVIFSYVSWLLVQKEEQKLQTSTHNLFQVFLDTTQQTLQTWRDKEMQVVLTFSRDRELINHFKQLLKLENDPAGLISHPSQRALRRQLKNLLDSMDYQGYFLISPAGISLASSRDSNIGTGNLLLKNEKLFAKVMAGQPVLSIPVRSDVPLENLHGELQEGLATMFALAPVVDRDSRVIGALALRIDPQSRFIGLLSGVRLAKTGEAYVVDRRGLMLSESRFVEELHTRGLLPPDVQQSELNVMVREPDTGLLTRPARDFYRQLSGESLEPYIDYRGVKVVGAWRWLDDWDLGLVTEIDAAEVYADLKHYREAVFMGGILTGVLSLLVLILLAMSRKHLEDSKAWQQAIVDNMIDGVITINDRGIIKSFAMAAEKLFGYTAPEVIGRNVSILMSVDVAAMHDEYIQHRTRSGGARINGTNHEVTAHRKDGTEFLADVSVTELWIRGSRFYTEVVRDMTSRKQAEEELRQFRSTLDHTLDCVFMYDAVKLRFFYANEGALQQVGYTHEELMTMHPYDIKPDVSEAQIRELITPLLAGKQESHTFETIHQHKNGQRVPVEIFLQYIAPVEVPHFIAIVRNISERKAMRQQLGQQKKLLDMLHQSLTSFVEKGDFRAVTGEMLDALLELTGCEYGLIGEVLYDDKGRPYLKTLAVTDIAWDEAHRELVRKGLEFHNPNNLLGHVMISGKSVLSNDPAVDPRAGGLPKGHPALNSFLGVPIFYGDQLVGMYGIANHPDGFDEEIQTFLRPFDTSYGVMIHSKRIMENDDKNRAELIKAKDAAEAANRAKSTFLATMSHEIRTPMSGVLGMINLLRRSSLNVEQQRLAGIARESAVSLVQIINDILDFSRIEAGEMTVENIEVDVPGLVEGLAEALFVEIHNKRLRLYCLIEPDVPVCLTGDPVRLRQILMNLLGNAIKFTQTEEDQIGEIQVCVAVDREESGDWLRLEVIDNGIGLSQEQIDRLFHPFTQADSSTHRRFGGSGLGLTICARMTEMMGGVIGCDSKLGKGSRFWVRLPVQPASEQASQVQQDSLSGLDMLLLCDNPLISQYLQRDWSQRGARVRVCDTLEQALAWATDAIPQVVILDGDWGEKEAQTILERFHESPDFSACRFVVVLNDHEHAKELDYHDSILVDGNPLRPRQLRHAIAVACGRAEPDVDHSPEQESQDISLPTLDEAEAAGNLILVVEDNIINQKVIELQLNMFGYRVDVAADGRAALKLMETHNYGLVLTDCNMPEMDGFELTAAIRERETGADKKTPILAITANALQGEAGRCLAAGMDDYIAKPVELNELKKLMRHWLPLEQEAAPQPDSTVPDVSDEPKGAPIDPEVLAAVLGSDESIQLQFLQQFLPLSDPLIAGIQASFEGDQLAELWEQSHKLKSSAHAVGAVALSGLCQLLEDAAKVESRKELEQLMPRLLTEWERVRGYIQGLDGG